ncbi:hypothetical protein BDZ91DRAFT_783017 [Kalaharituber pfeilii]|nr:hypothetical protein BDZ91DRAFT_783017 [Kalaharituber pfeilii]
MAQQSSSQTRKPTGRENLVNAVDAFSNLLELSPAEKNALSQAETPGDILELTESLKKGRVSEKKIKRCEAFLQSVQQFSGVVDSMIQHSPFISALVWGSIKLLLQTAQNYVQYFSCLADLFERLGALCTIFKEFQDLWPHYQGLQDAVFEYYAQTVVFCTGALKFLRRSGTRMILKALVRPLNNELQNVEKKLLFQQKIVEYQVVLAREVAARKARQQQLLLNSNWEAHREDELQWRKRLEASAKGIEEHQLQQWKKTRELELEHVAQKKFEERQRLLRQISDYNHTVLFLEFVNARHPRTGEWLFEMDEYRHGIRKISLVNLRCDASPRHGSTEFEAYLARFFDQYNIPSTNQWQELFIRTCRLLNNIYLILDGIDECQDDTQAQILGLLTRILSIPRSVKVYISSRKDVYLTRNLPYTFSVSLDNVRWRPEIEGYIDASLRQRLDDGRLQIQDPAMVEEIKQALMVGVEGMQLNDEEIRATLRSLPRNLDETYIRMLQRIVKERKKDVAVEAFQWLIMAKRRLTLRELVEAVVIRDDDSAQIQGLNRIPMDLSKIIEACGNFLMIEEPVCDSSNVRFIHSTVVTFLHTYELPVELKVFQIERQTTEAHLAKRCLQYLHFQDLRTQLQPATTELVSKPARSVLSIPVSEWIPSELRSSLIASASRTVGQSSRRHVPESANLKVFNPTSAKPGADSDASRTQMQRPAFLLDYVIENWLGHCERLPTIDGSSVDKGSHWTKFRDLIFNGSDLVTLPWPSDSPSTADDPHHERFKWAVQNSHEPLVQLILQEVASGGISTLQYLQGFLAQASAGTKYERVVSEMPLLVSATLGFPHLVMFYLSQGSPLDCEFRLHETELLNIYYKLERSLITIQNIYAKHYIPHVWEVI